jgi:secreted trypsin-like serine protease
MTRPFVAASFLPSGSTSGVGMNEPMTLVTNERRRRVLGVFVALMAVVVPAAPAWAIVNGTPVYDPGAFPCMVSLQRNSGAWWHSCGGVLIDASTVLTAAGCVDGALASNLRVAAGGTDRSDLSQPWQFAGVGSYTMSPTYNVGMGAYADDIAIINLATPLMLYPFSPVQACPLAQQSWDPTAIVGAQCTVVGWGRTGPSNVLPNVLQEGTMEVISLDEASQRLQGITGAVLANFQFPLFDRNEQTVFSNGDTGGPVFCPDPSGNQTVYGTMSWSISGGGQTLASYPAVATLVGPYWNWIAAGGGSGGGNYGVSCANPLHVGMLCDDGDPCTYGTTCDSSGACTGGTRVDCSGSTTCQTRTCNGTPSCTIVTQPSSASCDDNNACTSNDHCDGVSEKCIGGTPVTCGASGQCHLAGTCDPSTGCSNPNVPDGTLCYNNGTCTSGECISNGEQVLSITQENWPPAQSDADALCNSYALNQRDTARLTSTNLGQCVKMTNYSDNMQCTDDPWVNNNGDRIDEYNCTIDCSYTLAIDGDPKYTSPQLMSAIGSYPYVDYRTNSVGDACEQQPGGAQVCQAIPFPPNITPQLPALASVQPQISSGNEPGQCDMIWTQCLDQCGGLSLDVVIRNLPGAAWCLSNCDSPTPGSEQSHWKAVPRGPNAGPFTQVSGLAAGGPWDDRVCPNAFLCKPGATCSLPTIANNDFGPQHYDRDFEFSIVPILNGALDGSALNDVDLAQKSGGGFPALGVEVEYMDFYPREGAVGLSLDVINGGMIVSADHSAAGNSYRASYPANVGAQVQQTNPAPQDPWPFPSDENYFAFKTPVKSLLPDGWRIDMPSVGDQITTKGVLIWDCGHLEQDRSGQPGYHTEIHPPVATAWLHRPLPGDSQPQSHFGTLFVKAMSHAPYPATGYYPFDGFTATFKALDYDPTLPLCINGPIMNPQQDYNTGIVGPLAFQGGVNTYEQQRGVHGFEVPADDVYGYYNGVPDILVNGLPKYWSLSLIHSGGGNLTLNVQPAFGASDAIYVKEAQVDNDHPLLLGTHYEICQPKSSGCAGTCAPPERR